MQLCRCHGAGPVFCETLHPFALPMTQGMSGFHFRGGGGESIEPPKTGGGGFGKRAQLTGTINQSL